jgi:ceramide glucosyltransferase
MDWYLPIACAAILAQLLVVYYAISTYHYVSKKLTSQRTLFYRPRTALLIPCRGLDARFATNLRSFFEQEYENYDLLLAVEDESDPAYRQLIELKNQCPASPARGPRNVQILVAGPSQSCSQKIHNLLYALERVPADCEILAFADSDVCVRRDWLGQLVMPLYPPKRGATTGYRWFIPTANNPATLALSAINGAIAQFLGSSLFNLAWGGSMAIRAADFRRLGLGETWSQTLSDDLSLSRAVRRAGLRIAFVPKCLVASFESTTWRKLYEFGRRQLLITRVYTPVAWWLGFLGSFVSVLGLWGGAAAALYAVAVHAEHAVLYAAVPLVFLAGQITRAVLRQISIAKALNEHLPQLLPAALADVFGCWLWSLVLFGLFLASAFGRTIRWRGIRYKLLNPTNIQILDDRRPPAPAAVPDGLSESRDLL